jgi:hypothetical protein
MTPLAAIIGACIGVAFGAMIAGLLRVCAAHFPAMGAGFWRAASWLTPAALFALAVVAAAKVAGSGARGADLANRSVGVVAIFTAAVVVALSIWRASRLAARAPRFPRSFASSSGGLGLVAIALAVAGLAVGQTMKGPGVFLGVAGGLLYLGSVIVEIARGRRSFDRVLARIADARDWPLPHPPEEGTNPYEASRATGRWRGATIWVALIHGGVSAKVALERWPSGLGASRSERAATLTGDPTFDRAISLDGDPAAWRPLLTAEVRRLLLALLGERQGHLDPAARTIELLLPEAEVGALSSVLDQLAALAAALPSAADPAALFDRIAAEPLAQVRRGHYGWLVGRQWNVPQVLRAAAADPDPAIAGWARTMLPSDRGVYR